MEENVIVTVDRVEKVYPGGVKALGGISFSVREGEIFGLVGPNGAGKTTTFRIIASLIKPTSGKVIVDGVDVVTNPFEARKRIAYVPEEVGGYRRLTGLEYLKFIVTTFLRARGASREEAEKRVDEAVELTGLPYERLSKTKMGDYSKGMKRRLQVAWVLAVKPKLAILDEPTTGLDVEASYELRHLIKEYSKKYGMTVLISSHNMFEVETVCDRVALIKNGLIIDEGAPREIVEKYDAVNLEDAYMKILSSKKAVHP